MVKMMGARYAIYYTPAQDTALWQLASAWLGRDAATDTPRAHPPGMNLSVDDFEAATANPARYGFHSTLVAPFELAPGVSEAELESALASFAGLRDAFAAKLEVGRIDNFFALVPKTDDRRLDDLAADCVECFDRFRAPLSEADLARRAAGLTEREHALLLRWGYPFVMDAFQFHMSLTGPLPEHTLARLRPELEELYASVLAYPTDIDGLSLAMQPDRASPFHWVARHGFAPVEIAANVP